MDLPEDATGYGGACGSAGYIDGVPQYFANRVWCENGLYLPDPSTCGMVLPKNNFKTGVTPMKGAPHIGPQVLEVMKVVNDIKQKAGLIMRR